MTTIASIAELSPGLALPEFARTITTLDLVKYAGATDDYAHQHWDHLYMTEHGFDGVIVHGWFTFGVMCQAVTSWIPPHVADIVHYSVRYHRTTPPGLLTCGGEVVGIDANGWAELSLWARDPDGVVTTTGALKMAFA